MVVIVNAHTVPKAGVPDVITTYLVEAGCEHGQWRLRTIPAVDRGDEGVVEPGPPFPNPPGVPELTGLLFPA